MKYKINKTQSPLTGADISPAQDFDTLLKNYNAVKLPFYRTGKFFAGSSAVLVATVAAVVMLLSHKAMPQHPKAFISPPIAAADIQADSFTVPADSASEINYKSGSKLHIPAQAFRDADGRPVTGRVMLRYREFHDQKDIYLSGIPMTYDSAGQSYVFQSAGMMEITASQDGHALVADSAHPVRVDMVSNTADNIYNTYYLDTAAKKWINLNRDNMNPKPAEANNTMSDSVQSDIDPVIERCKLDVKKATAAVKAVEKEKPMPIIKADKDKIKFHIVISAEEFPEIAMYQGVRFQVKDETTFDKTSANVEWQDVKLKKLAGIDYLVTFTKGIKKMEVVATPVITDKDLPAAQKIYDGKYAEYQAKLTERLATEKNAKKDYAVRYRENLKKYEARLSKVDLVNRSLAVYRSFTVYGFGTYNCDHPIPWPIGGKVIASLVTEQGAKLNITSLNLVEKDINSVFPYQVSDGECMALRFDAAHDNVLWAITADNKLAIVDAGSFRSQQQMAGKVQFKAKVIDKELKSSEEVRNYLEI